nr:hypothetical protein BaRGS_014938 [Batillaria attramentaria]
MTSSGTWKVRIDVSDWAGNKACATYTGFYITGSSDNYRLMLNPGSYSGNAGDSLSYSRGRPFSTHDANRDRCSDRYFNCARTWHGAWWFDCCFSAHLNGEYKPSSATAYSEGILWENFRGFHYSLKFAEMKLKPL